MPELLAVVMLVLFVGAFAFVIAISMLRSALRINESIALQQAILDELRSQKATPES